APFWAAQVFDAPAVPAGAVFVHNNDFHFPAFAGCGLTHIHYPFGFVLAVVHWDAFSFFWFYFPRSLFALVSSFFVFYSTASFYYNTFCLSGKGQYPFSVFYFYKNSAVFHKTTKGRCFLHLPFYLYKKLLIALCVFVLDGQL
ncbi:hypothetical protein, partial [Anaerotignum lactatifermentans]|uniref:hypothetical protein n=1 Tax=Anaerotignum lactatifermentans TaxID=160404 RepID=UPI003AB654DB